MQRDDATLLDIVKSVHLIQSFLVGMSKDDFLADQKTQSAVLHQLTIMGEAVKRLSRSFREQYPILPWKLMSGMRDHLIHGYDTVDLEEVWNTAYRDVPEMMHKLKPLLPRQAEAD